MAVSEQSVPVLIIGGGPVGLTAALCLAEQNISSIVIEKHPSTTKHPKARGINCRSMEIFRQLGIEPALREFELEPEAIRFIYINTFDSEEVARASMEPIAEHVSPTRSSLIAQHFTEQVLFAKAQENPLIELHFASKVVSLDQNNNNVTATIEHENKTYSIDAEYCIAADGASSPVREQLGINMLGKDNLGDFCSIYCEMDLSPWVADRKSVGFAFTRKDVLGCVLLSDDGLTRWLAMVRYDVLDNINKDSFTDEFCIKTVKEIIQLPEVEVKLINKGFWNMAALIAEEFRVGRIFLAGDAAHRLPPTGGLGMNTGIQDAHNLAWKLAMVINQQANDSLLDSYGEERARIAYNNIQWSAKNAERFTTIYTAIYEDDMETAKAAIKDQYKHLNHIGLDIGYYYPAGAIIASKEAYPETPIDEYHPNTLPGYRLPHHEFILNNKKISSLDLFKNKFVLLSHEDHPQWHQAAESKTLSQYPLISYQVGPNSQLQDSDGNWLAHFNIEQDGALLIRPDGHVAWRTMTAPNENCSAKLDAVFTELLN